MEGEEEEVEEYGEREGEDEKEMEEVKEGEEKVEEKERVETARKNPTHGYHHRPYSCNTDKDTNVVNCHNQWE